MHRIDISIKEKNIGELLIEKKYKNIKTKKIVEKSLALSIIIIIKASVGFFIIRTIKMYLMASPNLNGINKFSPLEK